MIAQFSRIQNLHISQTPEFRESATSSFSRIQNLHISQTTKLKKDCPEKFSRIQNLHISQTIDTFRYDRDCLVEFKIYISLKHSSCAPF